MKLINKIVTLLAMLMCMACAIVYLYHDEITIGLLFIVLCTNELIILNTGD